MDFDTLLAEPTHRRGWLLLKALECVPLDQAIDLARTADRFVVGDDHGKIEVPASVAPSARAELAPKDQAIDLTRTADRFVVGEDHRKIDSPASVAPSARAELAPKPETVVVRDQSPARSSRVDLAPSQRVELLERAAKGANNAELAAEFGLKPRQVQGLRMVAARTKRASTAPVTRAPVTPASAISATADEVVRYLRQRDDVVVPESSGTYLVNGRFRLDLAELVAKANRARDRENKPLFKIEGLTNEAKPLQSNGHHVFWPTANADTH